MSVRSRLSRFFLRLGTFLQSLPVVIMKPDDLVAFSRQSYFRPESVGSWMDKQLVDSGLCDEELKLMADFPPTKGALLLLGLGGGREAIPFARNGYRVTGVDYVREMVHGAIKNARERGVDIEGLVQEISELDVATGHYDVVWMSRAVYSFIPSRARRLKTLRRIARSLKTEGILVCQFMWMEESQVKGRIERVRRILASTGLFNSQYEIGDSLWLNVEFLHLFPSQDLLRSELEAGGFCVDKIYMDFPGNRGGAICRRKEMCEPEPHCYGKEEVER